MKKIMKEKLQRQWITKGVKKELEMTNNWYKNKQMDNKQPKVKHKELYETQDKITI